jgi:DMSO/TMAO reductase YedYZ molybdopterin-dependent catalytic subunit
MPPDIEEEGMENPIDIRRRQLLLSGAGAATAAGLGGLAPEALAQAKPKPLPKFAEWKYPESMIVHSASGIETKRSAFGTSVIVPNTILFVRNNIAPPDESITGDIDGWTLAVEGVGNPGRITVGDLRRLGVASVASVLQCSGNGRGFFKHKASGSQWKVGAAGCVIWSGVPLAAVAKAMGGVASGAKFITGAGGERLPAGVDPKTVVVERSVPLSVLDTALLAWEMNGEPLQLAHGGPLRLVIPGYYGVNNIKYITRLGFTEKETAASIQTSGYRVRPIGQKGATGQPSMWEMNVKSWINYPSGEPGEAVRAGMVQIHGVAFAGVNAAARVEVSLDGGNTWKNAQIVGPDLGRYAWRQFVFAAELKPGTYMLASRATDTAGNTQPPDRVENERAYGHNGWRDHAVRVTVA